MRGALGGWQEGHRRGQAGGPEASSHEGCVRPRARAGASPTHTCLRRSLRVTPPGGVAKWGGAKLPGSIRAAHWVGSLSAPHWVGIRVSWLWDIHHVYAEEEKAAACSSSSVKG